MVLLATTLLLLLICLFAGKKLYTKFYNHARNAQIDVDGNPYKGTHPAFKLHPNDKGMAMIAETIFDAMF